MNTRARHEKMQMKQVESQVLGQHPQSIRCRKGARAGVASPFQSRWQKQKIIPASSQYEDMWYLILEKRPKPPPPPPPQIRLLSHSTPSHHVEIQCHMFVHLRCFVAPMLLAVDCVNFGERNGETG